jgi:hypothetical protein
LLDVLAHVIDLAVVPSRAIWRVQMKHWDGIGFGEGTHSVSEPIANLPELVLPRFDGRIG